MRPITSRCSDSASAPRIGKNTGGFHHRSVKGIAYAFYPSSQMFRIGSPGSCGMRVERCRASGQVQTTASSRNARRGFEVRGLASIVSSIIYPDYSFRSTADRLVNGTLTRWPPKSRRSASHSRTCGHFSKLARWSCGCTASGCHVQPCGERSPGSPTLFRRSW
jgi:hypothetical protein